MLLLLAVGAYHISHSGCTDLLYLLVMVTTAFSAAVNIVLNDSFFLHIVHCMLTYPVYTCNVYFEGL